jgi:hypothetical protein
MRKQTHKELLIFYSEASRELQKLIQKQKEEL